MQDILSHWKELSQLTLCCLSPLVPLVAIRLFG